VTHPPQANAGNQQNNLDAVNALDKNLNDQLVSFSHSLALILVLSLLPFIVPADICMLAE